MRSVLIIDDNPAVTEALSLLLPRKPLDCHLFSLQCHATACRCGLAALVAGMYHHCIYVE